MIKKVIACTIIVFILAVLSTTVVLGGSFNHIARIDSQEDRAYFGGGSTTFQISGTRRLEYISRAVVLNNYNTWGEVRTQRIKIQSRATVFGVPVG